MVMAAADIKPAVTGSDMNSTRKPDRKTEAHKCMDFILGYLFVKVVKCGISHSQFDMLMIHINYY
jgi:hypothetical protein